MMLNPSFATMNKCVLTTIGLCYLAIGIACLVLIGWIANITFLTSISPSFEVMHITTAILIVLCSIALLLKYHENVSLIARRISMGLAIVICGCCFISVSLLLYFNEQYVMMPFSTAINLFLLSIVLIFMDNEFFNNKKIFSIIIMFIFLSSLFSLLGYIFIEDAMHQVVTLTRMSIYTSIELFILSSAMMFARPNRGIIKLLLDNSVNAYILRRIPIIVFLTIIVSAYIANLGQRLHFYDDGFADLFGALCSIIILIGILTVTSSQLRKQEMRGDKNEALFLGFSENVDDVFWETTIDMEKILHVSPAFDKVWGQSRAALINNPSLWFNSILPKDQLEVKKQLSKLQEKPDSFVNLEYQITLPDDTKRYIYDRRFLQKDKHGEFVSMLGISTDVTRLHATNQRILTQHAISKMMESGEALKNISPKILQTICMTLDWDIGEMLFVDEKENQLKCFSMWHKENINSELISFMNSIAFSYGAGVPGKVWKDKKSSWSIDSLQPLKIMMHSDENFMRTLVAVPILYKNSFIGVLAIYSQKIKQLDESFLNVLEILGLQLGEYIAHRDYEEKITKMVDQDGLTGLMTRQMLEKKLAERIDKNPSKEFPIIIIDLDKFNLINESFDYEISDRLLKVVSDRLEKFADKKFISRMGSNIFAMIPDYLESLNQITTYVYKILSELKKDFNWQGKSISITASIGISHYPKDGKDVKELLKNATLALTKAKQEGGDNFQFYTHELIQTVSNQFILASELRSAIDKNELLLYFQPKINVKTGKMQGVESLIRWHHPSKGVLTPNLFMPVAEENNLVIPITEWIILESCNIIKKYKLNIPIAINLSAEHFKGNFKLAGYLDQILKGFHVSSSHIDLEMTETVLMNETKHNLSTLIDLKKMGFKIAIDDFGTGFSSLNYLKNIAADYIKIDKSFVDNIPHNLESVIIIKAIIDLAHALKKEVIAEGVETLEQLQFLIDQDCDQIQGYYFSKPLPIEELIILIKNDKKWDLPQKS